MQVSSPRCSMDVYWNLGICERLGNCSASESSRVPAAADSDSNLNSSQVTATVPVTDSASEPSSYYLNLNPKSAGPSHPAGRALAA